MLKAKIETSQELESIESDVISWKIEKWNDMKMQDCESHAYVDESAANEEGVRGEGRQNGLVSWRKMRHA